MRNEMLRLTFTLFALAVGTTPAFADAAKPTFDDDVLPILKQHCVNCHGNDKQKGGLNAATFAATMAGGGSGAVVVPGDANKSRLYTLTNHSAEPKMPPSGQKIPDAQIAILRTWVEQGARENSGSKAMAAKPKVDIGLKSVSKGRPEGPPPMPIAGKFKLEPLTKARRPGAVLAMAASPWAPLVAIGGQKQVILQHADTGDILGYLPYEHGQINNIKFSRNGKMLLVAGGRGGQAGKAVLFNVETGDKIVEVGIETDALLAADISPDQTMIAVGSPSKLIRLYSTADGSVVREIKKHTDWVCAVEFSPDGVLLATGDRSSGLFVWESFTGREYFSLRGHTAMITDVSWRDDSNCLASCSEDGTIKLWEMENGGNIRNWGAHGGGAASVKFSHDGRLASTGRDRVTKLWDQNGAMQKQFEAFPDLGLKVAINHDNAKVFGGDWSGTVKAWAAADGKVLIAADTNPKTIAEQIEIAKAAIAAAEAKVKPATDALAAAKVNVDKANAELAPFVKAVTDLTNAANTAKAAADQGTVAVTAANAAVVTAQSVVAAKQVTAGALQEAANKVQAAATATPANAELKNQATKTAALAKAAADEVAAANKGVTDAQAAAKVAADKLPLLQKTSAEAMPKIPPAQKVVADQTAARKPVFDAFNAATANLNAVNAEVAAAKAKLEKLTPKPPVPAPPAAPPVPAVPPAPPKK
jgi:WD40 repeat protein